MDEKKIWDQVENLPSLPDIVTRVMDVTSNPESSAKDLLQAILPDQSMCISILKIANSALFGQPKTVSSIERAIMILGFNEVQSIVLGRAAVNSFGQIPAHHKYTVSSFWEHSFACGLAAKTIAEHVGLSPGDFFIGGLIHDIGKLAMLLALEDEYDPGTWMLGAGRPEIFENEKLMFGVDHGMVGAKLLQKWAFPNSLLLAVAHHHRPEACLKGRGYPLIIQLADFYAHLCNQPHLLDEVSLEELTNSFLPKLKKQWLELKLPWEEVTMEAWFNWLKIETRHGSSVMSILASDSRVAADSDN